MATRAFQTLFTACQKRPAAVEPWGGWSLLCVVLMSTVACGDDLKDSVQPKAEPNPAASASAVLAPTDYGLDRMRDHERLRPEDNSAYYGLLHHTQVVNANDVRAESFRFMTERMSKIQVPVFKDMLDHPEIYRGQLVMLEGHTQEVVAFEALENPWGIKTLYEASFFEENSQGNLTTVVFLNKPLNLGLGERLVDGVSLTGYFLKVYHYDAEDNHTRKAPLIIAYDVRVKPAPIKKLDTSSRWLTAITLATFSLLIGAVVWVQIRDRKRSRERQMQDVPDRIEGIDL